jgi:hypothetical protein
MYEINDVRGMRQLRGCNFGGHIYGDHYWLARTKLYAN